MSLRTAMQQNRRLSIAAISDLGFFVLIFGALGLSQTLRSNAASEPVTVTFTESTESPTSPLRGFYEWRSQNIIQENITPPEAYDRY